jgi:glutaredoxin-related protein
MSLADRLRAKAHAALERVPGVVGDKLRNANEVLGRPLADKAELEDRRAFGEKKPMTAAAPAPKATTTEQAPVIVYYMEKQKRDVSKLTDILDANGVKYTVTNIQEDPAAQYAVRRDSNGARLPVVFIAGDCIGGREALVNASSTGELKKRVFGA